MFPPLAGDVEDHTRAHTARVSFRLSARWTFERSYAWTRTGSHAHPHGGSTPPTSNCGCHGEPQLEVSKQTALLAWGELKPGAMPSEHAGERGREGVARPRRRKPTRAEANSPHLHHFGIMGDVLPFERSDRGDRRSEAAPDDTPSASEDEAMDLGAFLIRQLERLNARQRAYTEKLERLVTAISSLKERMSHGTATDDERVVILNELEGVEALRDALIATTREVSAQFRQKFAHLERMETHRRESGREAA